MNHFIIIAVCFLLIAVTFSIFRDRILLAIGDFLIVQDPLQPADVIHVISGPDYRTAYAIQIYQQNLGKRLFFTGGWCAVIQGVHADRSRIQSLEHGISESAIESDPYQVVSTYQEVERLKLWMDVTHTPITSILVVSDPHHMRRARWAYRKVFGNHVKAIMAPVPFDQTPFQQRWWVDRSSRLMVRDEYGKFLYYFARYKFSTGRLKEWLASLDKE